MLNFKGNIKYYLSSTPTDMRKGREGLSGVVREVLERDPHDYNEAFIFYSKDLRKVKILHYDLNGFVIYEKWFDDGRFLSPYFNEARRCHRIGRELLMLLLSTSVQTRITIDDEDGEET
jgi:hypothetical protein